MKNWYATLLLAFALALLAAGVLIGVQEATEPVSAQPQDLSGASWMPVDMGPCAVPAQALAAEGLVPAAGFTLECPGSSILPGDSSILSLPQQVLGWTCFAGCGARPVISISPAAISAGGTTLTATLAHEFCHTVRPPMPGQSREAIEIAANQCATSIGHGASSPSAEQN